MTNDSSSLRQRAAVAPERLKQNLLLFMRRRGYEIAKLNEAPQFATLMEIVTSHGIEVVFDVGANEGQFGRGVREAGFSGEIVSFEPLGDPFARLASESATDSNWTAVNAALAEVEGTREMAVAANLGMSSSFREMTGLHTDYAPNAAVARNELVRTLGWDGLGRFAPTGAALLKLDLQGFEGDVLRDPAAAGVLVRCEAVVVEVSCAPLYVGAWTPGECVAFMEQSGFEIYSLFPEWFDRSSMRLLQFNAVFVRATPATTRD